MGETLVENNNAAIESDTAAVTQAADRIVAKAISSAVASVARLDGNDERLSYEQLSELGATAKWAADEAGVTSEAVVLRLNSTLGGLPNGEPSTSARNSHRRRFMIGDCVCTLS